MKNKFNLSKMIYESQMCYFKISDEKMSDIDIKPTNKDWLISLIIEHCHSLIHSPD